MIDRNVEFPDRYRLVKVPGTTDIYDIVPAPGDVVAEGDYINRQNLLPDEVEQALGLTMENPQVKDALLALAGKSQEAMGQTVPVDYIDVTWQETLSGTTKRVSHSAGTLPSSIIFHFFYYTGTMFAEVEMRRINGEYKIFVLSSAYSSGEIRVGASVPDMLENSRVFGKHKTNDFYFGYGVLGGGVSSSTLKSITATDTQIIFTIPASTVLNCRIIIEVYK